MKACTIHTANAVDLFSGSSHIEKASWFHSSPVVYQTTHNCEYLDGFEVIFSAGTGNPNKGTQFMYPEGVAIWFDTSDGQKVVREINRHQFDLAFELKRSKTFRDNPNFTVANLAMELSRAEDELDVQAQTKGGA